MDIDSICEMVSEKFNIEFIRILNDEKIFINKSDFDYEIIDYIENTFDCDVEFKFLCNDNKNDVEIIILENEKNEKIDKIVNELMGELRKYNLWIGDELEIISRMNDKIL